MKRKTLVKIHITGTAIAFFTIATFFTASLIAEIDGSVEVIKDVKQYILFFLPLLLIAMPVVGITGNRLAGKSRNPTVLAKQKRMKYIFMNGITLTALAVVLYIRSHSGNIDNIFMVAQIAEFAFGLANLILIALNIRSGLHLSGRFKFASSSTNR